MFSILILLAAGFFCFANIINAEGNSIIISAVQINGTDANDDFIELYNTTCTDIDLSGWKFKKRTKNGTESSIGTLKNIIPAKGYYLWENTSKNLDDTPDYSTKTYYLANDYSIALYNKDDEQIDSITWGNNLNPFNLTHTYATNPAKFESLLRNILNDFSISLNYSPKNSTFIENDKLDKCPPLIEEKDPETSNPTITLRINEIFPNPSQKGEENEYIEIYNYGPESVALKNILLSDKNESECPLKIFADSLAPNKYLLIENKKHPDCKITVQNSKATFKLFDSSPANIFFSAKFDESAKDDLSYNFNGSSWRWSKFLTPGAKNIFNNLPDVKNKIPKKVYANMYADFSAEGNDQDNDKLKYTWDFGDGHKSYLQNARHKYEETGKYTVALKTTDGSEDIIKTFKITVEKFPEPSVKIVSLSPNPTGADTGVEFLSILNKTKKKINLKGWSIASGTKTLSNHPITEVFFIKPKKIAKLTYEISKFTLPNTKGKIEIHYPNGKVASHITYGDKKKTIAENATYEKAKSGWKWNAPVSEIVKTNTAPTPPIPPIPAEIPTPTPPEEITPDPEIEKNLGKFSEAPEIKIKQSQKFSILNFGLGIKTAQASSILMQNNNFYLQEEPSQKNWFTNLRDDINYFLNKIFNIL